MDHESCPRCTETGAGLDESVSVLRRALSHLGIEVVLEKEEISAGEFERDPLESNRIWIGGRPIEELIGTGVFSSTCCDTCGDAECRTVVAGGETFEAVPARVIMSAALSAAAALLMEPDREGCCSPR